MTYHVARNNQQLGTFEKDDTLARYNRGEILPTDLVWTEGMSTWQPASQVLGAPAAPAIPPPVPAPSPDTPPPVPVTGVATPMTSSASGMRPPKPNNNLVGAILVTLFCCWPLGIPSIVFAAQVDGKYNKGDYTGAEESAKKSRTFMWWSLGLGIAVIVFAMMMGIVGAIADQHHY